jgi:hypothetical protein
MGKEEAMIEKETTLRLTNADGEVQDYKVKLFFDPEKGSIGVIFLEGEWITGLRADAPAAQIAELVEEAKR